MKNRFETLNAALNSECLIEYWPSGLNLGYGECGRVWKDGKYVTVTRFHDGQYERPIHYATRMHDICKVEKL